MEHILKIEALTKQYNRHNVIDNVNMSVQAGAIYGLIGRNVLRYEQKTGSLFRYL